MSNVNVRVLKEVKERGWRRKEDAAAYRKRRAEYRRNNRYKINIEHRKWSAKNRDKIRARSKKYYYDAKASENRIIDYLKVMYEYLPCLDCKGIFPYCAMDWDHKPEHPKSFGIGSQGQYTATPTRIQKVEKEIDKCSLVCSNCHRVRTHILRQHKTHNSPNAKRKA